MMYPSDSYVGTSLLLLLQGWVFISDLFSVQESLQFNYCN